MLHLYCKGAAPALLSTLLLTAVTQPAAGLMFEFNAGDGVTPEVQSGFEAAGRLWSDFFLDDITVTVDIGFQPLSGNRLGSAFSSLVGRDLDQVSAALTASTTNAQDRQAAASVVALGETISFRTGGGDGAAFQLDDGAGPSNTRLAITLANARALGLAGEMADAVDGQIVFNSGVAFDFDRSDGISGNAFDFVGTAAHELGHILGFTSGNVFADDRTPEFLSDFGHLSTLDLFRYSEESLALEGSDGIDISTDFRVSRPFFSIDGGRTVLATFETGTANGTGFGGGHFSNGQGFGLLDPRAEGTGNILEVSELDLLAFDVIGYELIPEPASGALLVTGTGLLLGRRRSREAALRR